MHVIRIIPIYNLRFEVEGVAYGCLVEGHFVQPSGHVVSLDTAWLIGCRLRRGKNRCFRGLSPGVDGACRTLRKQKEPAMATFIVALVILVIDKSWDEWRSRKRK